MPYRHRFSPHIATVHAAACLFLLLASGLAALAQEETAPMPFDDPMAIVGDWVTQDGQAVVRVRLCEGIDSAVFCGTLFPFVAPEDEAVEYCGFPLMRNFVPDGAGRWIDGTIVDPRNGSAWDANAWLEGADLLRVRGYLGISLLGRTQDWPRWDGTGTPCTP